MRKASLVVIGIVWVLGFVAFVGLVGYRAGMKRGEQLGELRGEKLADQQWHQQFPELKWTLPFPEGDRVYGPVEDHAQTAENLVMSQPIAVDHNYYYISDQDECLPLPPNRDVIQNGWCATTSDSFTFPNTQVICPKGYVKARRFVTNAEYTNNYMEVCIPNN